MTRGRTFLHGSTVLAYGAVLRRVHGSAILVFGPAVLVSTHTVLVSTHAVLVLLRRHREVARRFLYSAFLELRWAPAFTMIG